MEKNPRNLKVVQSKFAAAIEALTPRHGEPDERRKVRETDDHIVMGVIYGGLEVQVRVDANPSSLPEVRGTHDYSTAMDEDKRVNWEQMSGVLFQRYMPAYEKQLREKGL